LKAYLGCDIGKTRDENQDSIRAESYPDGVLALVCDGMGGMQNGSAASKIAVAAAEDHFRAVYQTGMNAETVCELLRSCAADANQKVYQAAIRSKMRARMGTTLVGVFARDEVICLVNIGDSRAYLLPKDGEMRQLTTDHTVVQLLYEQGMITAEERMTHARRNELMRAVGVSSRVLADIQTVPVWEGDCVLLCSDGLYGMVSEERIAEIIRENPPEQVPDLCIAEANANGGRDNISVILLTH
jgi:serine/threonine protein phosphatase PrpC